jgi:hypothetical protein
MQRRTHENGRRWAGRSEINRPGLGHQLPYRVIQLPGELGVHVRVAVRLRWPMCACSVHVPVCVLAARATRGSGRLFLLYRAAGAAMP